MPIRSRTIRWVATRVRAALARQAELQYRRPHATLIAVGVLTVLALAATVGRLKLDADLSELLPPSFESIQDLEALKERFGGTGYVVVVAQNAPPEALEKFAADVAPKLEQLPGIRYIEYKRPTKFFEDRTLYFLDVEDLELVRDRLAARMAWEKRNANPLYLDLEDSEPPSVDLSDIEAKYAGRGDTSWVRSQMGETYYIDRDRRMIALMCKPSILSIELASARELINEIKKVIAGMDLDSYHPGLQVAYAGVYAKKVDQHAMVVSDLKFATTLAALLIVLFLALHFRRFAAVALVIGPLLVGLAWTHAFAALVFGSLNILTGFIGAVLLGLGIDHGIHLLGRFEEEWSVDQDAEGAVRRAFGGTGRAVTVAALTTTVAFGGLGLSEFRAFREFGIIAAVGMVLVVVAYLVTLPALLGLAARHGWRPRSRAHDATSTFARWLPRHPGKIVVAGVLLTALSLVGFLQVRFDYDFRSLVDSSVPSFKLDHEVDRLLGYSQAPVAVLTRDEGEERYVAGALRAVKEKNGDASTIDFVVTGTDLIPLNQQAKQPVIAEIGDILADVKPKMIPQEYRPYLAQLRRMTSVEPFAKSSLPLEVRRQFYGGGDETGFVVVFPTVNMSDGGRVSDFAAELRSVKFPDGRRIVAAGEPMILADVVDMVRREATPVLATTLVLVFLTMWVLLGRLRFAVICLVPAVVTFIGTLGLMDLIDLPLNYVNIVMIPVLFGIGVDGGVHIASRMAETGDVVAVINDTGRAVSGALLTTALGFGALLLADHHGLNTLGEMAVLGLAVNLLVCLALLPALLLRLGIWRRRREQPAESPHVVAAK